VKEQEDAGIDIVSDGEQSRQHFVHGFLTGLDGIDFEHKIRMGIRDNRYEADCPTVVGALKRRGSVHGREARIARAHTAKKLKWTLPGPMTIVDTIADKHYGDRATLAMAFAEVLNEEARELDAIGVDVIQFDEPAFNVYADAVKEWGVKALERAAEGLHCATAVHICYGYGIKANIDWKNSLGAEWRQYEAIFPALAQSKIDQVSLECINSRVPLGLLSLLGDKQVALGAIDVATDRIETAPEVADTLRRALQYVPLERLEASTNCGMAPLDHAVAIAKLQALAAGVARLKADLGYTRESGT
jgi:5-methyltetrahydropteroyltriglutamate--homocysteine methyltransferase